MEYDKLLEKKLRPIWNGIRFRTNKIDNGYHDSYKKHNIKMCKEWEDSFEAFYCWAIDNGYKFEPLESGRNKWSIDRIDTYGDYCPENCRWTTSDVQCNNKTNNKMIELNGECMSFSNWCRVYNIPYRLVAQRLKKGWDLINALEAPMTANEKGHYNICKRKDVSLPINVWEILCEDATQIGLTPCSYLKYLISKEHCKKEKQNV